MINKMNDTRPEGNITDSTKFVCKLSEEIERVVCDAMSAGTYTDIRWGSPTFVKDWVSGKKHDPLSEIVKRIRFTIRKCGNDGISKKEIQYITGILECGDYLRELDKAGLY